MRDPLKRAPTASSARRCACEACAECTMWPTSDTPHHIGLCSRSTNIRTFPTTPGIARPPCPPFCLHRPLLQSFRVGTCAEPVQIEDNTPRPVTLCSPCPSLCKPVVLEQAVPRRVHGVADVELALREEKIHTRSRLAVLHGVALPVCMRLRDTSALLSTHSCQCASEASFGASATGCDLDATASALSPR